MGYFNLNSGYGQALASSLYPKTTGKLHVVVQAGRDDLDKIQDLFTEDHDGDVMFHVNSSSGNGFNSAIDACDTGNGDAIYVAPGFYWVTSTIALDKNDITIFTQPSPEGTMLFGTGTYGSVAAATFDLITITGNNNVIDGLGLYTHLNTAAAIKFDDAGGAATAGFNEIKNCYFSPQAADGQAYGIEFAGGSVNYIHDCVFEATATAGILLTGSVGNPARTRIINNWFVGTNTGISITSANYQTLIKDNTFTSGSQSGYNMTNAITISAGMNAGDVSVYQNNFEQSAANDISDSKAGGDLYEAGNVNAS